MLALALTLLLAQTQPDQLGGLSKDDAEMLQALQGSAAPDEPALRAMVEKTLPRVAKVMGLPAPRRVQVRVVSSAEASRKLLEVLRREYPGDRLARLGRALQLVHLVEPGLDLEKAAHEL